MSEGDNLDKPIRKNNFLRTVIAVLWSFIGIRKSSGFQEDTANIKPLQLLAVGVVMALLFVIGLIVVVNLVVAS
jgi:amino acid transporter